MLNGEARLTAKAGANHAVVQYIPEFSALNRISDIASRMTVETLLLVSLQTSCRASSSSSLTLIDTTLYLGFSFIAPITVSFAA